MVIIYIDEIYVDDNLYEANLYWLTIICPHIKLYEKNYMKVPIYINSITLYEEVSFNPIYDKYKNIIGACCFSIDITDHLIHIRLIERQNEQLKKIAWVQSHEVRSPLATIKGLVQLFNSDDITAEDNIVILDGIMQAVNILDEVIKKTVAYTEKI